MLVAGTGPTTQALQEASRTVPIVFAQLVDPVGARAVKSLARPGGNITGFTQFEYGLSAKWLELLREIWGAGAAVSRRAVDTHIARLRRKLEDDPANPRHILTALAWGYRFRP